MQVQTNSRYELLYPKTNVDQVNGYIKPWKVGDVRITSRTDLSDNWLLCNGNTVAESAYPELYAYGGNQHKRGQIRTLGILLILQGMQLRES